MLRPCSRICRSPVIDVSPAESTIIEPYNLFHGLLHIKYVSFAKHTFILFYLLRAMQMNLEMDVFCYDTRRTNNDAHDSLDVKICLRPPCLWLHWVALRLPRWFIREFPPGTCTFLLFFVLLSSVLMVCAIYLREREIYGMSTIRRALKVTMVVPSVATELLFAFFMYCGIFGGVVHWRNFNVSMSSMVLAITYAVILCFLVLAQMIAHIATILYVCKPERNNIKSVSLRDYTCGQPTPTQSLLEILKHPSMATRPLTAQFSTPVIAAGDCGSVNNNELPQKADTQNSNNVASADFVGYGRLRRAMIRGNTVVEDNTPHRVVPPTRLDMSTSSNSDYSQIRNYDQAYTIARNIRHGSGASIIPRIPPNYMDSTYLEVV